MSEYEHIFHELDGTKKPCFCSWGADHGITISAGESAIATHSNHYRCLVVAEAVARVCAQVAQSCADRREPCPLCLNEYPEHSRHCPLPAYLATVGR